MNERLLHGYKFYKMSLQTFSLDQYFLYGNRYCSTSIFLRNELLLLLFYFLGQYYTDDQFLNIYSFSMLYKWLHHSHNALHTEDHPPDGASDHLDPSKVFKSLVGKTIDYCFRILDQCERSKYNYNN